MLGTKVDIPFYVTATALGKLGNPEGEVVLTRGAKKHNVVQMIPTLASCSFDEICDAAEGDQVQWLQLYVSASSHLLSFYELRSNGYGLTKSISTTRANLWHRLTKTAKSPKE